MKCVHPDVVKEIILGLKIKVFVVVGEKEAKTFNHIFVRLQGENHCKSQERPKFRNWTDYYYAL